MVFLLAPRNLPAFGKLIPGNTVPTHSQLYKVNIWLNNWALLCQPITSSSSLCESPSHPANWWGEGEPTWRPIVSAYAKSRHNSRTIWHSSSLISGLKGLADRRRGGNTALEGSGDREDPPEPRAGDVAGGFSIVSPSDLATTWHPISCPTHRVRGPWAMQPIISRAVQPTSHKAVQPFPITQVIQPVTHTQQCLVVQPTILQAILVTLMRTMPQLFLAMQLIPLVLAQ